MWNLTLNSCTKQLCNFKDDIMQQRLYCNTILASVSYFPSTQLPFLMELLTLLIVFDRLIDTLSMDDKHGI